MEYDQRAIGVTKIEEETIEPNPYAAMYMDFVLAMIQSFDSCITSVAFDVFEPRQDNEGIVIIPDSWADTQAAPTSCSYKFIVYANKNKLTDTMILMKKRLDILLYIINKNCIKLGFVVKSRNIYYNKVSKTTVTISLTKNLVEEFST